MKRMLIALIAYVLGYCAFAELPQSVDEVLFGEGGDPIGGVGVVE